MTQLLSCNIYFLVRIQSYRLQEHETNLSSERKVDRNGQLNGSKDFYNQLSWVVWEFWSSRDVHFKKGGVLSITKCNEDVYFFLNSLQQYQCWLQLGSLKKESVSAQLYW